MIDAQQLRANENIENLKLVHSVEQWNLPTPIEIWVQLGDGIKYEIKAPPYVAYQVAQQLTNTILAHTS